MGQLSDFFLATPADVDSADLSVGPGFLFDALEWKGVDTIKLAQFEEWLTGADPGDIVEDIVREGDEWLLVKVSSRLVAALAALDSQATRRFAKEWLLSDDDQELLGRLVVLARSGQAKGKNLFLWLSW